MFNRSKVAAVVFALGIIISLVAGCSSSSLSPSSSASVSSSSNSKPDQDSLETRMLEIDTWKTKMAGKINKDYYVVDLRTPIVLAHLKAEGYTNVFVLDNPITIDKDGKYRFE